MSAILQFISNGLVAALYPLHQFLNDGNSRYYSLYCLTGLIIAFYAYRKHTEAAGFEATLRDKKVWLSASAINDYIIIVLMPVLRVTILAVFLVNPVAVAKAVTGALAAVGVSGSVTGPTAIVLGLVLTVTLFIVDDLLRWFSHWLFHRIPELWEFHKVHHSAEVLNFATAERHHPVEVLLTGAIIGTGCAIVNGIFIALFGDKLTVTTVCGANIFLFAFNVCGGVLRHSPFWVSFGPRVERWIISPAMHQIHHSNKPEHFDRNFGGSLAVWDRLAGSLHIPKGREIDAYGIGEETADYRSLKTIFFRPFASSFAIFQRRVQSVGSDPKAAAPVVATPAV